MATIARIISDQIRNGKTNDGTTGTKAMSCWGARQLTDIGNGLAFRVSGMKFKGIVEITINNSDLYNIHFINGGKLKEKNEGVYFDMLTSNIDKVVEGC